MPRGGPLYAGYPRVLDRTDVRGRFEMNLRIEGGTIDTNTPSIVEGIGFSVAKNGAGDVTITFSPKFSAPARIVAMSVDGGFVTGVGNPTATTARVLRKNAGGADADGVFSFIVMGSA